MNEALLVRGLTKSYGGKKAVDHLDLSVRRGTVFGLLGANGAGKAPLSSAFWERSRRTAGRFVCWVRTRKSAGVSFSSA